jgi:DNA-binding protein WhiA
LSLSDELRNELAAIEPQRECDALAELSGLAHVAAAVHLLGGQRVALHFDIGSSAVARRAFQMLRRFGVDSEIRTYRRRAFDQATRYQLHVPGGDRALQVLHEAGILTSQLAPLERPPRRLLTRACCRGAYLRGTLLGSGSLSGPRGPHLEIRFNTIDGARFLAELVESDNVSLRAIERARHAIAYTKGAEAIAGALAAAGASDTALVFAERAFVADTKSRANRLTNADHANLVRTSRAAHMQLEAIRTLTREGRLQELPPAVQELAQLRLQLPRASLRELAKRCDRPTSKAAAHRRLRKLVALAHCWGRAGGEAPRSTPPPR